MPTDPNTIKLYNENAANYHAHVSDPSDSIYHAYYEKPAIRTALPPLDGLDVISIGCGSGVDARWLKNNGAANVTGIDISEGLINIAKSENSDIEFCVSDMEHLDFPNASFDLAYSSLAIHYLDNWTQALREAHRVLKPGGQYIFTAGHPVDTAIEYSIEGGMKYAVVGRRIDQQTRERKIYGDYIAAETGGVRPLHGALGDIDVTTYHHTFGKMVEYITAASFTIKKVVEPQPVKELETISPEHYKQLIKVPAFMLWVLQK